MHIVILDAFALNPGDLAWEELYDLGQLDIYDRTPTDLILERVKNADAIFY